MCSNNKLYHSEWSTFVGNNVYCYIVPSDIIDFANAACYSVRDFWQKTVIMLFYC